MNMGDLVMKTNDKNSMTDRRGFMKMLGVSAVSGGAALGAGGSEAKAQATASKKDGLYKETEHVKTYYDLAKF